MSRTLVAITGASSGIGATFARKLAPEHDLLLIARRRERLEHLAEELSSAYACRIEVFAADLTNEEDLSAVAERLRSEPRLALLVNNAGFGAGGFFWEAPLQEQETMHRLHVMAVVRLTHAALETMVGADFGAIVNVASVSAFVRSAGSTSYCATKSWMTAFTETIYLELKAKRSNVTVQALCPGFTYSEFHDKAGLDRQQLAPATFWLSAEDVVDASIDGLNRRKLFVIPGWRYRLLTGIVTRLPATLRLLLEGFGGGRRQKALEAGRRSVGQLSDRM